MKFKLVFLIAIIALIVLAYFGYPIMEKRYFSNEPKIIHIKSSEQEIDNENANVQINNSTAGEIKSSSIEITVSPSDCDNECSEFKKENELEYCREVCGLSNAVQENTAKKVPDNCESASGLQKDYCLKDLAIKNKDFKTCDTIVDSGVKKACKNRITEDIIESQ